ncbi:hypothetical protein SeMB42_g03076 [Synchytrium endobioticum]|uniref:Uncharacterized protein n=1 Tax=Synchytrium endobioticum TaxID=286115 RepID=A0A507CX48_9FUNG|nr:hypothetical protein SeLEV6574_g04876 [Synchytrium endobioticum]TPX48221.1 hypothetical protein SeMB42_g03076 [Synchytrium endobioticum]
MRATRNVLWRTRLFSTTRSTNHSSRPVPSLESPPLKVTSYPYDLFVHPPLSGSKGSALSFVKQPSACRGLPELAKIGWILDENYQALSPDNVHVNPLFEALLHDVLRESIHTSTQVIYAAATQREGFLNINDARTFVPYGRVAEAEDILGFVRLDTGTIVPDTYERCPTHRIVSTHGLFQLSEEMHGKLLQRLSRVGLS